MSRTVAAFLALALIATPRLAGAQLDATQWREDLEYFGRELPARHEHLFDGVSRTVFESAARRLVERLPSLTRAQITVELARLVAMVRDGHPRLVEVSGPHALGWHRYPVRLAIFDDGVFIDAATADDNDVIGARVTRIGSMAIDDAIRAVDPFIPQDNPMTARSRAPGYLVIPEILVAAGIATDSDAITLGVERDGRAREVRLTARGAADRFEWIDMREASPTRPLWMSHPSDRYWFAYLADTRTAYVQFNNVYSPFFWPYTYPGDERTWIAPHVAVAMTSRDVAAGRDPAMEAILRYRPQPPLADELMTVTTASGVDAALARLAEWQADPAHKYRDTEWDVHLLGRRLMIAGRLNDAITVFEVNAAGHPASHRAFEDLGMACEKAGDLRQAAAHYRKSLTLNPANLEPADGLERIEKATAPKP